jgi:hypothetical protein
MYVHMLVTTQYCSHTIFIIQQLLFYTYVTVASYVHFMTQVDAC